MDRAAAMIQRFDAIRRRLDAMPRRSRQTLVAAYCTTVPELDKYDRLGPVVVRTRAARGAYLRWVAKEGNVYGRASARIVAKWCAKRFKTDLLLKSRALEEADEMLTKACRDWRDVG
jgi:hypothetical protein